jgi:hypothetical protein
MSKDFPSAQLTTSDEIKIWNDTVLHEDVLMSDEEAFQAELPSLASEVGKWAVYFHGKRLGIFPTYTEALVAGWEIAGSGSFFAERISRSICASIIAFFKF